MAAIELVKVRVAENVDVVAYGRRLREGDTLTVPAGLVPPMIAAGVVNTCEQREVNHV